MRPHEPTRKAWWLRTLHQWHWISAAICLAAMLLFSITGITLNHAAQIATVPQITRLNENVPQALLMQLLAASETSSNKLPKEFAVWVEHSMAVHLNSRHTPEWSEQELYLSLPRAGGDAWLRVDLERGVAEYEMADRGWIAYFNDLHKGRNTGTAWKWFIDLFAVATLLFSITGLLILKLHATRRPTTWPLVGLGIVLPVLLALLFIH